MSEKKVVKFSEEQLKALMAEGENYLISAGAGSGKTEVLTRRIARIAKREGTLSKFLVLTFTNLAAGEMKARVRKLLLEDDDAKYLASEVDNAHIETFDSFSLYLAKKYFYVLGISKNLNIVDQSILTIKRRMILEEVIDEHIIKDDKVFKDLVLYQSVKNLNKIKDFIINILIECDRKGNKEAYLNHLANDFYNDEFVNEAINIHFQELKEYISYVRDSVSNNLTELDYVNEVVDLMDRLDEIKDYDSLIAALEEKYPTYKGKGKCLEPEIRDSIKKFYDSKLKMDPEKENYFGDSQTIKSLYLEVKPFALKIVEICQEIENRLDEFKLTHNAYSFGDISSFVLKLLENEDIRKEISQEFDYIMVDEYQDTNDIQEKVISSISRNNVYMVGDVKQSIYKFRGADCRIFQDKYEKYKKGIGGKEIDLNTSYRSRKEVVDFVNEAFERIMNKEFNSIDYSDGHKFGFGRTDYEINKIDDKIYQPEVFNYIKEKGMDTSKVEAEIIAKDILKRIKEEYPVYQDKESNRKCSYGDFAIIIDRTTDFNTYRDVLANYGIPLKVESKEKLFTSDVIVVLTNLLKMLSLALDNDYSTAYKHAFFSIARSFLLEYKDDRLYEIHKNNQYLLEPFAQKIELLKESLRFSSIKKILLTLLEEFEIYESISKIANYYSNVHKLETILSLADNMDVMGYTIKDFVQYFDDLADLDIDIDYKDADAQSNSVTLINIHGSKGLEYGIVYFPGLGKKFNDSSQKSSFMISEKYGLVLPPATITKTSSLFNHLVKEEMKHADFEEYIRLLYVALTRTKEKIIFVNGVKENEKEFYKPTESKCMKDLLGISKVLNNYVSSYTDKVYEITKENKDENIEKIKLKTVHIPAQLVIRERASKEISLDVDPAILEFGSELHFYLETLDFEKDDLSYIKNNKMRKYVANVKNSELFKGIKNNQIRHEFAFYDEENNVSGFIDALIIKENEIDIVDFKLRNIADELYDRQLRIYKKYVAKHTTLNIKMYLLAAITGEIREVKDE